MKEDALKLTEYVLESESEDFIHQLLSEPSYIEEGIISEEVVGTICNSDLDEDEIRAAYKDAALNPKCTHPYALAYRIWVELKKSESENPVCWYNNACQLHRTNGPAVVYLNGDTEYWIEGVQLTEQEFREKDWK